MRTRSIVAKRCYKHCNNKRMIFTTQSAFGEDGVVVPLAHQSAEDK